jgi:hypothetical protein
MLATKQKKLSLQVGKHPERGIKVLHIAYPAKTIPAVMNKVTGRAPIKIQQF